jgi:hypothetical protein
LAASTLLMIVRIESDNPPGVSNCNTIATAPALIARREALSKYSAAAGPYSPSRLIRATKREPAFDSTGAFATETPPASIAHAAAMHAAQIPRTTASLPIRLDALRTCHCPACFFEIECHRAFGDDLFLERCYVPCHVTTITKLFAHETPMFGGPAFFT